MTTFGQGTGGGVKDESLSPNPRETQFRENIHLLSIGSVEHSYALYDASLQRENSQAVVAWHCQELRMIHDCRELWVIPRNETVHVAILDDTLSLFELEEACRLIRRQWPATRIVVINARDDSLDDALYDDRVMPGTSAEVLLTSIDGILERRRE
jgi:DNA-binding response OmpR family regulator